MQATTRQHQPIASSSNAGPSSSASSSNGKPDRLYVGNLSPTVDEYTLIQVFSKYGKITKLDFMFHKTGVLKGKPRGFAFIQFSDKDDALKAMVKLHDRLLRGRKLVVTYASSAPLDNLPPLTKGRRPTEPAKTTTLSLLKTSKKPQSAAHQIAAMEAKLASMAKTKPAGEDYIPGQSSRTGTPVLLGGDSSTNSAAVSAEGSPMLMYGEEDQDSVMLGDAEGEMAARDLEREMGEELARAGTQSEAEDGKALGSDPVPTSTPSEAETSDALLTSKDREDGISVEDVTLTATPAVPGLPSRPLTAEEKKKDDWQRGLAGLPKRPAK